MAHVRRLAALGNRVAGSPGEAKAIRYIDKQFRRLGLTVVVEPFEFRSFALERAVLHSGGQSADIVRIVFDPYAAVTRIEGEVVFVPPAAVDDQALLSSLSLKDKLVVTQTPANAYRLNRERPQAVAFVSAADFDRLAKAKPVTATVEISGREARVRSANVVASLGPRQAGGSEVIVSAHLDSVRAPGAGDNASGVAVLLELARYYRSLGSPPPARMTFVALGAEEAGMIGAKAYLSRHLDELKDCVLVFNMDSIGGNGDMHVEMRDGVQGVVGKAVNQLPADMMTKALTDIDFRWMYIPPHRVAASNVPPWLQDALQSAAAEAGLMIVPSRDMGSDHSVFAQAGIVATNVSVSGMKVHTPEDVPGQIAPKSLENAARLVAGVVSRVPSAK